MSENSKLVVLGECSKPHGLKGGFSVALYNYEDSVLSKGLEVILRPKNSNSKLKNEGEIHKISQMSFSPKKAIIYFGSEIDRTRAEEMIPFELCVGRDIFPELDDEFYVSDLIGLEVYDHLTQKKLGVIKDFYDTGAQIVLEIRGIVNTDLPFIDNFFPVVDIESRRIEVIIPEAL